MIALIKDVPDVGGDRVNHINTLSVRLGAPKVTLPSLSHLSLLSPNVSPLPVSSLPASRFAPLPPPDFFCSHIASYPLKQENECSSGRHLPADRRMDASSQVRPETGDLWRFAACGIRMP